MSIEDTNVCLNRLEVVVKSLFAHLDSLLTKGELTQLLYDDNKLSDIKKYIQILSNDDKIKYKRLIFFVKGYVSRTELPNELYKAYKNGSLHKLMDENPEDFNNKTTEIPIFIKNMVSKCLRVSEIYREGTPPGHKRAANGSPVQYKVNEIYPVVIDHYPARVLGNLGEKDLSDLLISLDLTREIRPNSIIKKAYERGYSSQNGILVKN